MTMYAIVKTGGKQYRVEKGQKLLVERLTAYPRFVRDAVSTSHATEARA